MRKALRSDRHLVLVKLTLLGKEQEEPSNEDFTPVISIPSFLLSRIPSLIKGHVPGMLRGNILRAL